MEEMNITNLPHEIILQMQRRIPSTIYSWVLDILHHMTMKMIDDLLAELSYEGESYARLVRIGCRYREGPRVSG